MLYRSDSLAQLDDSDLAVLGELGLSRVTDFRSEKERQIAPDRLPQQTPPLIYRTVAVNNPALDVAELNKRFLEGELNSEELIALTDRRAYVHDEALRAKWGQWLRDLANPGALPQMFHCTAGKDRTGYAAALALLTLGVSREDVMRDFLLSNEYLQPRIEGGLAHFAANSEANIDPQLLRKVLGVTAASLTGAFEAMEATYGSIDAYIEEGLGVDADTRLRLQSLLLE
jgi:protein-tyrosine phosphatase